jgi:hypothetical protein
VSEASLLSRIGWGAGALVVAAVLVAGAAGTGISSLLLGGDVTPSATAAAQIPPAMLALYQEAAATCPGLPWTVLAAIGTVESGNGTSDLPGVHSGANFAGAEVIYRWDGGLWHLRDEAIDGRGSLVSEGSLSRGQGGGHSGFIGSPAHDDQLSSVASVVSI